MARKKSVSPKNRNVGIRRVKIADIRDSPHNFRRHPQQQRQVLEGAVDELGWYGYPDVWETPDGTLQLCDGHLRKALLLAKYGPDAVIDVNVTDFTEPEAKLALATKDPLAATAEADATALHKLLADVQTGNEGLGKLLAELAESHPIPVAPQAPTVFPVYDESIPTDHECPKCGYRYSGGASADPGSGNKQ